MRWSLFSSLSSEMLTTTHDFPKKQRWHYNEHQACSYIKGEIITETIRREVSSRRLSTQQLCHFFFLSNWGLDAFSPTELPYPPQASVSEVSQLKIRLMETPRVFATRAWNWSLGLNFGTGPACSGSPISVTYPECWDSKLTNSLTHLWVFLYSSSDSWVFDWVSSDYWWLVTQSLVVGGGVGRHSNIHVFAILKSSQSKQMYVNRLLEGGSTCAGLALNKYIYCVCFVFVLILSLLHYFIQNYHFSVKFSCLVISYLCGFFLLLVKSDINSAFCVPS